MSEQTKKAVIRIGKGVTLTGLVECGAKVGFSAADRNNLYIDVIDCEVLVNETEIFSSQDVNNTKPGRNPWISPGRDQTIEEAHRFYNGLGERIVRVLRDQGIEEYTIQDGKWDRVSPVAKHLRTVHYPLTTDNREAFETALKTLRHPL